MEVFLDDVCTHGIDSAIVNVINNMSFDDIEDLILEVGANYGEDIEDALAISISEFMDSNTLRQFWLSLQTEEALRVVRKYAQHGLPDVSMIDNVFVNVHSNYLSMQDRGMFINAVRSHNIETVADLRIKALQQVLCHEE